MRILYVEDKKEWADPLVEELGRLLKGHGLSDVELKVVCSGSRTAEEAREILNDNDTIFDIAILDLRLDEKASIYYLNPREANVYEGIELFEEYKIRKNKIHYVIFSAIPENFRIIANTGFEFPADTIICSKDFSWDEEKMEDEHPKNVVNAVREILEQMPGQKK